MRIFQWLEARLGFVTSLLFAEPTLSQNIKIVDDSSAAVKLAENADNLLISIPKCLTRKQIDNSLDRIFRKELSFEKGRQTRNPPRSNRQICPKGADVRHPHVTNKDVDLFEVEGSTRA